MKLNLTQNNYKNAKRTLVILPVLIVALLVVHISYVYHFNHTLHTAVGNDTSSENYMAIGGREDATSTWIKRDVTINGRTLDLNAATIDGTMVKNSNYKINEWTLTIYIQDECYLNNGWNGTFEIHQDVNGEEKVQTLKMSDVDLETLTLDHDDDGDGDLLIPLHKGDYIIYTPSEKFHEVPVEEQDVVIGFIFYYEDEPDLTDYELDYYYHRSYTSGHFFYLILALLAFWILLLTMYITSRITYERARREMEIKKNGMLSMADIYAIIYVIDLEKNTLTPIVASDEAETYRPKDMSARDQLLNFCKWDCEEAYVPMAIEFSDIATLQERMEETNTVAFEYVSKNFGWSRLRFFAMDREKGAPLTKVIYAIQEINAEKAEVEEVAKRVTEAELESKAKSTFLANMSHEIRTPINTVIGLDTMILRESKEPAVRSYARDIKSAANMLLSLINGILDFSKLEADKMELVPVEYSLRQVILDVKNMVKSRPEFGHLALEFNISPNLPNLLFGDDVRLKQVMINLLTNAAKYTDEGTVTLSIYGKQVEDSLHLLISVKDTGIGIREEDQKKLTQRFSRFDEGKRNRNVEGTGIGLNLVTGILALMDSELHVVSKYGEGSDFYFEIDQKVMGDEVIGTIDLSADNSEEEDEYQALFTAKDAHVLVVDDNAMNLNVFESLLKETQLNIDKAGSGMMALRMTVENKYDLIFMDHMMPEMDGIETFHRLRKQESGKNLDTPVIILTANAIKGVEEEYLNEGFNGYLSKPIQPELLEEMIAKYLDPSKLVMTEKKAKKASKEEKKLPTINGLDATYGVSHTGGFDALITVMKQFVSLADADRGELMGYFDAIKADPADHDAIKSFRIKVHSMKSSANLMGAIPVSGVAASLEDAAQKERSEEILAVTPFFAERWSQLKNDINEYLKEQEPEEDDSEKEAISDEMRQELLHQLTVCMKSYDLKNADAVLEKLNTYAWNSDEAPIMELLKNAISILDAEKTEELCNRLSGKANS